MVLLVRVYGTAYVDRPERRCLTSLPLAVTKNNNSLLIHCDFELWYDSSSLGQIARSQQ